MIIGGAFLTTNEEEQIKLEYERQKKINKIDYDIIDILDEINAIDGLVTLYSCQGHLNNPISRLAIKFEHSILFPASNAIWDTYNDNMGLNVDWEYDLIYKINNQYTLHKVVLISGNMNYSYMNYLSNKLKLY